MVEEEEEEEEVVEEEVGEGMRAGIQNGGEILKFCNFKKCEFGTVANSFQVLRGNILVESKSQVEKTSKYSMWEFSWIARVEI